MSQAKNYYNALTSTENIGASTNQVTKPLITKVVAAVSIMIGLLLLLTVFSLWGLNRGREVSRTAIDQQLLTLAIGNLRNNLISERASLLNTLYTGQSDPRLQDYQSNFDTALAEIAIMRVDVTAVNFQHDLLKKQLKQILAGTAPGRTAWEAADRDFSDLLNQIEVLWNRSLAMAVDKARQADQVQTDASSSTLILAMLVFSIIGIVLYFVAAAVIGPLRELNNNLTRLLWGQTEHLTDRLNMLQAEINLNNDMLTTVRHDLKSPLSSIKGLAELSTILQPDLSGDVRENLHRIVHTADESVATISATLARREQSLDLQKVALNNLVDKVLQLVDLRYYTVQRQVEVDEWVLDAGLMEHALLNLLSNARKFSMSGIGVGVQKIRKAGTVGVEELEVWVWNDGTVITAEDRAEIFKPGKQTSEGKRAGGHGLGLSIVKSIAEMHHGRVTVDSHEKVGTTFRIFIPALRLPVQPELAAEQPPDLIASSNTTGA